MSTLRKTLRNIREAENRALAERAHDADVADALDAAQLAIEEYYNGDRDSAEQWLLKAWQANRKA